MDYVEFLETRNLFINLITFHSTFLFEVIIKRHSDSFRWILALKREITRVKTKMLSAETPQGSEGNSSGDISELYERKLCIAKVRQLPGNSVCADCSSKEGLLFIITKLKYCKKWFSGLSSGKSKSLSSS